MGERYNFFEALDFETPQLHVEATYYHGSGITNTNLFRGPLAVSGHWYDFARDFYVISLVDAMDGTSFFRDMTLSMDFVSPISDKPAEGLFRSVFWLFSELFYVYKNIYFDISISVIEVAVFLSCYSFQSSMGGLFESVDHCSKSRPSRLASILKCSRKTLKTTLYGLL